MRVYPYLFTSLFVLFAFIQMEAEANNTPAVQNAFNIASQNWTLFSGVIRVDGAPTSCTLTCPGNIIVSNDPNQCGAVVSYPAPITTGTCGMVTSTPASGSFFAVGTTTVTATSSDGQTCTFTITVNDTQAPSINCPANITVSNDPNQCGAVVAYSVTADDNCLGITVNSSHASGSFFPRGSTTVTSKATDASGNSTYCTFIITVSDTQAPGITCPANITVSNDPDQCGAAVAYSPTANDNCPGVTVISSPASGSFFPLGSTTVTSIATDAAGNASTCSFTITVNDSQAPVIACPVNITVSNEAGECGNVVNYTAPIVSDNCPGVTVVTSPASGSFFPVGTTIVTATATDAAGNTNTCTFTIKVIDMQAPIMNCPANITISSIPGQCNQVVNYTLAASDNCPGVTVVGSPASGSVLPLGVTTVSVTATDAAGNVSTCSFAVTVTDSDMPVITSQAANATVCASNTATFTISATKAVSYQWQVNTGNAFVNITNETSATLTLNNITKNMSGYIYRVVLDGICTDITSNAVNLSVNSLPSVQITAAPYSKIRPGQLTSMIASFDSMPGTFAWYRNGVGIGTGVQPKIANLNIDSLGVYKVVLTDVNGCMATSNEMALIADPSFHFFVYPNPNNGRFMVRFYAESLGIQRTVNVFNAGGMLVFKKQFVMNSPYERMDVDLTKYAAGIYVVVLTDSGGKVLGTAKVVYVR